MWHLGHTFLFLFFIAEQGMSGPRSNFWKSKLSPHPTIRFLQSTTYQPLHLHSINSHLSILSSLTFPITWSIYSSISHQTCICSLLIFCHQYQLGVRVKLLSLHAAILPQVDFGSQKYFWPPKVRNPLSNNGGSLNTYICPHSWKNWPTFGSLKKFALPPQTGPPSR